jgi:hypothetical protein
MKISPRKAARADYENNLTIVKKAGVLRTFFAMVHPCVATTWHFELYGDRPL